MCRLFPQTNLPVLRTVLVTGGDVMTLIKPQFEAGREQVGKKGLFVIQQYMNR